MLGKTFKYFHIWYSIFDWYRGLYLTYWLTIFKLNIFLFLFSIIVCYTLFSFQGTTYWMFKHIFRSAFGGDEENRTPDPLLARQVLSQLSYTPIWTKLVGLSGLEPPTSRLSGVRSNRLSYRPIGSMLDSNLFSHILHSIFFVQCS